MNPLQKMIILAEKYTQETMALAESFGFTEEEFAVLTKILNALAPVKPKRAADMMAYMTRVTESRTEFVEEVKGLQNGNT